MAEPTANLRATREAVQPSLWDRLLNDLPGVASEIDGLRQSLAQELGGERLDALLAAGPRGIAADDALRPGQKERLTRLLAQERRRAEIEARGIVVSADVLREAVRRDIEVLFNTERFDSTPMLTPRETEGAPDNPPSLADYPEVRRSVVNFGVPPFAGRSNRDFDREALARELRAVLAAFEPRLRESATRVTVNTSEKTGLSIEIDGLLIMSPAPERLRLRTLIDLETGRAQTSLGEAWMDRTFLEYYEDELSHIRVLAAEFADLHPAVARNLSLDTVPCPDPYVERLLEGVAYLAARTRLKLDGEGARFARSVLEALYPDLVAPTPAVGLVALQPGPQVQTMAAGHVVPRGTRLVAGLRAGLSTRATFTTAQDVTLWPLEIKAVAYHQDRSALAAAGIGAIAGQRGEAALKITLARTGAGALSELALDRLDLHFRGRARAPALFDTLFGAVAATGARSAGAKDELQAVENPSIVGLSDDEALMPRTRAGFEGYRLLREYFILPERFHFARIDGLRPVVARAASAVEIVFLLRRPAPGLADLRAADLQLFATPVINLFERDCNVIEIDPRRPRQVVHADRTRPRDFEIYRITSLEDADRDGPEARIPALFSFTQNQAATVWSAERRPRRPGEDERRQGRMRTSYAGDDVFLALSAPPGAAVDGGLQRVAPRALCTNRDLPILDDQPALTLESGDPVQAVTLLGALRPPRAALPAVPAGHAGESRADDLAWRMVAQLSLNYLGLAVEGGALEPLRATLELYADRGDPGLARHTRALTGVEARPVVERLPIAGPMCFGRGTEVTLAVDDALLAGHSALLLPALLARLFARYAAVNAFVQTRTRLLHSHEEVPWPITLGNRSLV